MHLTHPFAIASSDTTYSAICYGLDINCPSPSQTTWDAFSYQYIGIILVFVMGWTAYLPKLGKILDITSLGIYSIIINALFDFHLGIKSWIDGQVSFILYEDAEDVQKKLAFFTNEPVTFTVGVFAMAFMVHNVTVPMLRQNVDQTKNSRDLGYAYLITGFMYITTGIVGTMGLYWRTDIATANVRR